MSPVAPGNRFLRAAPTVITIVIAVSVAMAHPAVAGTGPEPDSPPPASQPHAAPASRQAPRESLHIGPGSAADAPTTDSKPAAQSGWFLRTAFSLAAVVALIAGSAAIAKALARGRGGLAGALGAGGRAPSGVISVLGRYPVSRGQKLVLLHLDRRVLLVAQSAGGRLGAGGGMATLCEITDAGEVASLLAKARDAESESMSERFRSMLGAFDRTFRPHADEPDDARRIFPADPGDRVELWDDGGPAPAPFPVKQPGPPEHDAVGSLRRRLEALRSETGMEASA